MSSPRAATSVATKTLFWPRRKRLKRVLTALLAQIATERFGREAAVESIRRPVRPPGVVRTKISAW